MGTCVNMPPASPKISVVGTPCDHDKLVTSRMTLPTEETRSASVSEVGLGINAWIEAHELSVDVDTDADTDVGIDVNADADVDVDVNLEALIDTLGTEWADCESGGEGEGMIPHVTGASTSSSSDMPWSTVVSRGTTCVAKLIP